ncbi:MAG: dephospho-CoA kinase [Deltaproteobacteria bacterium]
MKRQSQNKKTVIGVTGSFGSGKTTVAKMFQSRGAGLIDADRIARVLLRPGSGIYRKVIRAFGKAILKKNKSIDRARLAQIVFKDKRSLKELNGIIHPAVIRCMARKIKDSQRRLIVLDVPLLIEAGLTEMVDRVIVVTINKKTQIARLRRRTSLGKRDILQRINAQMPQSRKRGFADFIIDNSGPIDKTQKQVDAIRRTLWKS